MSDMTSSEVEVAKLLIESLNIEDIEVEDINPEEALFNKGLGLDSIDALELAMALSVKYGFQLKSDDPDNKVIFSSLRALTKYVEDNRK
ncbi:phosphopantetheine-binding protein [Sulfuriflexus sp.]|uniref:phosphopantetheine-binding protein n=1 Tax=Sulfuriflexus sp. TaxID=2015443 RepID=UPI0028CF8185|nr:phosphopantetheine-binding protein [Sulfuriflexus sp.]MDT8404808.1 phosphopantetheine-binding protein [Sulfuriflexus sp.]